MNLCEKLSIPSQVMVREVGDETVILDLASGTYYGLNTVGARIWKLVLERQSLIEVCDAMMDEYETTREEIERDVCTLMQALLDRKLVSVTA